MRRGAALPLICALLASGCDMPTRGNPADADNKVAALAKVAPGTPCAAGWTVRLDEPSFVAGNFPSGRLDEFLATAAASAGRAANEACAQGLLDPAAAIRVKTVTLASVADPAAPLFRADLAAGTARVEWNFISHDLTIPSDMEWRTGLACAIDVKSRLCPAENDAR